jgi:hypothetical protein
MKKHFITLTMVASLLVIVTDIQSQVIWDGLPMTFEKEDFADWMLPENQDRITDDIWITRGNSRPIFNAAEENLDGSPIDTRWAWGSISDGVENLNFDAWLSTVDEYPPGMVDSSMVLFLVSDSIYIDITFSSWTSGEGNGGGGFSYQRSTGDLTENLWTGPPINFTKPDSADWTLEANQDRITENVWLTRANEQGLFNIAKEDNFDPNSGLYSTLVASPTDTRWAWGSIADGIENLNFDAWEMTVDHYPPAMVDSSMVLFLVSDSIYIDITFLSWTSGEGNGGGGFSYQRSTGDPSQTIWTGSPLTFTKADSVDWTLEANQDRITDNVWLTRAHSQGLFNIANEDAYMVTSSVPAKTLWAFGTTEDGVETLDFDYFLETVDFEPPQAVGNDMVLMLEPYDIYIDIMFTSWKSGDDASALTGTKWAWGSIADGVETLEFDDWVKTIDENPPAMVDSSMVLFLESDSIYIDITFSSWTSGGQGGGFSYERSTGDLTENLWTGPPINFTKPDSADWTLEANQDRITDNVWITRATQQGIFNIAREDSYEATVGGGGFSYIRYTNPSLGKEVLSTSTGLMCYPNPASGTINISHEFDEASLTFELYNIQGQKVLAKVLTDTNQIDISHLNKGLYVYNVLVEKEVYSGKVVVE